jgi:hypothetical protein
MISAHRKLAAAYGTRINIYIYIYIYIYILYTHVTATVNELHYAFFFSNENISKKFKFKKKAEPRHDFPPSVEKILNTTPSKKIFLSRLKGKGHRLQCRVFFFLLFFFCMKMAAQKLCVCKYGAKNHCHCLSRTSTYLQTYTYIPTQHTCRHSTHSLTNTENSCAHTYKKEFKLKFRTHFTHILRVSSSFHRAHIHMPTLVYKF